MKQALVTAAESNDTEVVQYMLNIGDEALDIAAEKGNAKMMLDLMIHLGYISWSNDTGRYKLDLFNDKTFSTYFNEQIAHTYKGFGELNFMVDCFHIASAMREFFVLNLDALVSEAERHPAIRPVVAQLQQSAADFDSTIFGKLVKCKDRTVLINAMTRADFFEAMRSLPLWTSAEKMITEKVIIFSGRRFPSLSDSLKMFINFVLNRKNPLNEPTV